MNLKLNNMKRSIYVFLALGLLFAFQSCTQDDKNEAPENLAAPSIPPAELFTIPTQSFGIDENGKTSTTRNDKSNWIHAGLSVLAWNSVVFVNTAVPIAAFGHSFEYDAEYIGDLTWQWKYEYETMPQNGSIKYDVALTGQYLSDNDEVAWTMTVNESGSADQFVWFEGLVSKGNQSGSFTIYKDPQNPVPYVTIDYSRNTSTQDGTIRFTNVTPNVEGNGDYIEWRSSNGSEYDRAYDVLNKNGMLEIESNHLNKNGRVRHPFHFNDDEWHCWDTSKNNIDC